MCSDIVASRVARELYATFFFLNENVTGGVFCILYTSSKRVYSQLLLVLGIFSLCPHIKFTHDYATDDSHFPSLCGAYRVLALTSKTNKYSCGCRRDAYSLPRSPATPLHTSAITSRRRSCDAYTREFPFWDIIRSEEQQSSANGKYLYQEKCDCLKLLCCISFS